MSSIASSIFTMPALPEVGHNDFDRAARILRARAGIILGKHKQEMAERTLGMRAKAMGLGTVEEYLDLLEHNAQSPQWEVFINAFTINHTAFFREQHHFAILAKFAKSRKKPFSVWCSASSTGEEPYSIAMTLRESCIAPDTGVSIWATDIDTHAIEAAKKGMYTSERVKPVPDEYLHKYFLRGTGHRSGMVRVKPALRGMIEFDVLNLLSPHWPAEQKFDAIFCRNTMIYFDKTTQTRILERFATVLKPGGLLFAGHSENFTYLTKAFRLQGQTVYVAT
ncbi:CheR family methyltransferase [Pusillimonas sp. SM2304]|uniref:CheR family methyltransferase n=1 Tax=Pusillimonas sp. SM2304 TaxID=3073241 RepID=UPI00287570F4|nr:CheR family methyltransferase [Pusillimonas sp. SM2304]MDS1141105.1 CheR family methyltransferase [Pusillimonas sp. SM2304]